VPTNSLTPPRRRILEGAAIALLMLAVARYIARSLGGAWDFETFYWAAAALSRGLDPYRTETLGAVAGKPVVLPFLYPPATLALFIPLTWLPLHAAMALWLALKLALATALVALWRRVFLPGTSLPLVVAVAVFGYNAAMLWDLETGNVSILEQFLLWLAFACYVRERRLAFAALVAFASMFKLLPIVFLGLLFVPSRHSERRAGPALIGLGLFAAIVLLPSVAGLPWAHGFPGRFPAGAAIR